MATERQIEANRRNAARSTRAEVGAGQGPEPGQRHQAWHGGGVGPSVEAGLSPEFARPPGEVGGGVRTRSARPRNWALDRAVAASLRIERCERAIDELTEAARERARLAWDQDRAVEAATIAGRLARDPVLASRQLQTTLAGVELLVEAWLGLVAALEAGADWSESEASRALDLLGVAADLRSGRTPIDAPEGSDPVAFRRELALDEVDRLEALRDEAMVPLDEMERRRAMAGDVALLSKPAKLILRYERDAWRRYRESIRGGPGPAAAPGPAVASRPEARGRPRPRRPASFEEERRALLAEAAPLRSAIVDRRGPMDLDDEDAWLDELERRIDHPRPRILPAPATERTQFGGVLLDPTSGAKNSTPSGMADQAA